MKSGLYAKIYDIVRQIPPGTVATYGQVAYLVGEPNCARQVGWALAALRNHVIDEPVPWQRVVNSKGEARMGRQQVELLEREGVVFNEDMRIELDTFGWDGMI